MFPLAIPGCMKGIEAFSAICVLLDKSDCQGRIQKGWGGAHTLVGGGHSDFGSISSIC